MAKPIGLPPGGFRGPVVQRAKRLQNLIDGDRRLQSLAPPAGGYDAIADASEAHEARMAQLFGRLGPGFEATSRGRSKAVPG
jgi:hypothetical protein